MENGDLEGLNTSSSQAVWLLEVPVAEWPENEELSKELHQASERGSEPPILRSSHEPERQERPVVPGKVG